MPLTKEQLTRTALESARIAAIVANTCDHAEHNEAVDMDELRQSAGRLRALAVATARDASRDPTLLYAERLSVIERRSVLHHDLAFDGMQAAGQAQTWRDLQLVQIEHDRIYHPDVFGLKKADQLRHYALHVAKLAGAAAEAVTGSVGAEDFLTRRVADMVLFGIKLSTVAAERLDDSPVPRLVSNSREASVRSLAVQ
jgi:hypothetical protein